jgi:hypothetical protein
LLYPIGEEGDKKGMMEEVDDTENQNVKDKTKTDCLPPMAVVQQELAG